MKIQDKLVRALGKLKSIGFMITGLTLLIGLDTLLRLFSIIGIGALAIVAIYYFVLRSR